jgi:hypothetical protein
MQFINSPPLFLKEGSKGGAFFALQDKENSRKQSHSPFIHSDNI